VWVCIQNRKLQNSLRSVGEAKQFPPPLRSKNFVVSFSNLRCAFLLAATASTVSMLFRPPAPFSAPGPARFGVFRCTGVESVDPGIRESSKFQQLRVTKPAVRPSGLGDSNLSLDRPECFKSDMFEDVAEPKRVQVDVYRSLMSYASTLM
jgi:hypothetical protein